MSYENIADEGISKDVQIALIKSKTQIAITLAVGGMLSLIVGLLVLLNGVQGEDESIVKIGDFNISTKGLGAVIMGTSTIWAFLAYQSKPKLQISYKSENLPHENISLNPRFSQHKNGATKATTSLNYQGFFTPYPQITEFTIIGENTIPVQKKDLEYKDYSPKL